jgi:hypothetical protein
VRGRGLLRTSALRSSQKFGPRSSRLAKKILGTWQTNLATKCATHSGTWAVGEPGWRQGLPCGIRPIPLPRPSPPQDGVARGTGWARTAVGAASRARGRSRDQAQVVGRRLARLAGTDHRCVVHAHGGATADRRTRAWLQILLRQWQAWGSLTPRRARRRASEALTSRCSALPKRPVPRCRGAGDRGRHPGAPSRQPVRLGQDSDRSGSMRSSKPQPRYRARPHPAARCLRCVQAYD